MSEKKQNGCVGLAVAFAFLCFALSAPPLVLPVCSCLAVAFGCWLCLAALRFAVLAVAAEVAHWLYVRFDPELRRGRWMKKEFEAWRRETRERA